MNSKIEKEPLYKCSYQEKQILDAIAGNMTLSKRGISEMTNISFYYVRKTMKKLVYHQVIEHKGTKRDGKWFIKRKYTW